MNTILILSGGGAKGMLQSTVLKVLEEKGILKNLVGIFCTSVGSINGSFLASGRMTAKKMFDIYPEMEKMVFKKRHKFINPPPIYDRQNFITIFDNYIGKDFLFKNVAMPLVITTADTTHHKPVYNKSWKAESDQLLLNNVLLSFAAPYYFGEICDDKQRIKFGDGGMGLDNMPIAEALLEAEGLGLDKQPLKVIAIGCGFSNQDENYDKQKKEGCVKELSDFMNPAGGGMARDMSRNWQLGFAEKKCTINTNISFEYYDVVIPNDLDKMDCVSDKAIAEYKRFGNVAAQKPILFFNA